MATAWRSQTTTCCNMSTSWQVREQREGRKGRGEGGYCQLQVRFACRSSPASAALANCRMPACLLAACLLPPPADWHLNKRLGPSAAAFSRGLSRVRRGLQGSQRADTTAARAHCWAACTCPSAAQQHGLPAAAALQVIPASWLRLFSPREINQLLGGGEGGGVLDVDDMQAHTHYR